MSNETKADFIDPWECEVCGYVGEPENVELSKEEWGEESQFNCPYCGSMYGNGFVTERAKGENCSFCGEWAEEVVELNLGGSKPNMVCRECEVEHNG